MSHVDGPVSWPGALGRLYSPRCAGGTEQIWAKGTGCVGLASGHVGLASCAAKNSQRAASGSLTYHGAEWGPGNEGG